MKYLVTIGERTLEVDLGGDTPCVDGAEVEAVLSPVPGTGIHHLMLGNRSIALELRKGDAAGVWEVAVGAERLRAEVVDERTRAIQTMTGGTTSSAEKLIRAPMPGLVMRVEVQPGDPVAAGQGVVIVEAMKMENELKSPMAGVVARVEVAAGQTVEKGAVLLRLE